MSESILLWCNLNVWIKASRIYFRIIRKNPSPDGVYEWMEPHHTCGGNEKVIYRTNELSCSLMVQSIHKKNMTRFYKFTINKWPAWTFFGVLQAQRSVQAPLNALCLLVFFAVKLLIINPFDEICKAKFHFQLYRKWTSICIWSMRTNSTQITYLGAQSLFEMKMVQWIGSKFPIWSSTTNITLQIGDCACVWSLFSPTR